VTWTTALADLRTQLSDGPTDKLRYWKRVFGDLNGVNTRFKTFEFRRITNFTSGSIDPTLGVYLNRVRLSSAAISSDVPSVGVFDLAVAPADGDVLEASYYIQWFTDAELQSFVDAAALWLDAGTVSQIVDGLKSSALRYALYQAYAKLALRWSEALADTYRLQDNPDKDKFKFVDEYQKQSQQYYKEAKDSRDDFYTRRGRAKQPLFGSVVGRVKDQTPRT